MHIMSYSYIANVAAWWHHRKALPLPSFWIRGVKKKHTVLVLGDTPILLMDLFLKCWLNCYNSWPYHSDCWGMQDILATQGILNGSLGTICTKQKHFVLWSQGTVSTIINNYDTFMFSGCHCNSLLYCADFWLHSHPFVSPCFCGRDANSLKGSQQRFVSTIISWGHQHKL